MSRVARFEKLLGFDRGHATRTGCRDGLAITMVLRIPRGEDALDIGPGTVVRDQVAVLIHVELPAEYFGVGIVANRDEEALDRQSRCLLYTSDAADE